MNSATGRESNPAVATPPADAAEVADPREARQKARNRTALLWISVACLALAAAGYAFGRWLMAHPPAAK